jgi:hypothetical protein
MTGTKASLGRLSVRVKCTNRDIIAIWVSQRKLHCSSIRIESRFFGELRGQSARTFQSCVKVAHAKEQEQSVARGPVVRTHQRRMTVIAPMMKTEENGAILVQHLSPSRISGVIIGGVQQGLVPLGARLHIRNPDNCPRSFHRDGFIEITRARSATPNASAASRREQAGQRELIRHPPSLPVS